MWDDRSTVITNAKNVHNITRRKPTGTVFPPDEKFQDDVAPEDLNLALGATGDVAALSDVDIEGKDRDY